MTSEENEGLAKEEKIKMSLFYVEGDKIGSPKETSDTSSCSKQGRNIPPLSITNRSLHLLVQPVKN